MALSKLSNNSGVIFSQDSDTEAAIQKAIATGDTYVKEPLSYGELAVDNLLGLDNNFTSAGENLIKIIKEDPVEFGQQVISSVYEGGKDFLTPEIFGGTGPVQGTINYGTEIYKSARDIFTQSLDERLFEKFDVNKEEATWEQLNQAKEGVLGDLLIASEVVPLASLTTKSLKVIPQTEEKYNKEIFKNVYDNLVTTTPALTVQKIDEYNTIAETTVPVFGKPIKLDGGPVLPYVNFDGKKILDINTNPINLDIYDLGTRSGITTFSPTVEALRNFPTTDFTSELILPSTLYNYIKNIPEDNKAILKSVDADYIFSEDGLSAKFFEDNGIIPIDEERIIASYIDPLEPKTVESYILQFNKQIQDAQFDEELGGYRIELFDETGQNTRPLIIPNKEVYLNYLNQEYFNFINKKLQRSEPNSLGINFEVDVYSDSKSGFGKTSAIVQQKKEAESLDIDSAEVAMQEGTYPIFPFNRYKTNRARPQFASVQRQVELGLKTNSNTNLKSPKINGYVEIVVRQPSTIEDIEDRVELSRQIDIIDSDNNPISFYSPRKIKNYLINVKKLNLKPEYSFLFKTTNKPSDEFILKNSGQTYTYRTNPDYFEQGDYGKPPPFSGLVHDNLLRSLIMDIGPFKTLDGSLSKEIDFRSFKKIFNEGTENETTTRVTGAKNKINAQWRDTFWKNFYRDDSKEVRLPYSDQYISKEEILKSFNTTFNAESSMQNLFLDQQLNYPKTIEETKSFLAYLIERQLIERTAGDINNIKKYGIPDDSRKFYDPRLLHGFGEDQLAHSRYTINGDVAVIDELQFDAIQKQFMDDLDNPDLESILEEGRKIFSLPQNLLNIVKKKKENGDSFLNIVTELQDGIDNKKDGFGKIIKNIGTNKNVQVKMVDGEIVLVKQLGINKVYEAIRKKSEDFIEGNPSYPIKNIQQILEYSLSALILDAKKRGVKRIVLPNTEMLARSRDKTNTGDLEKLYIDNKIGFNTDKIGELAVDSDGKQKYYDPNIYIPQSIVTVRTQNSATGLTTFEEFLETGDGSFDMKLAPTDQLFKDIYGKFFDEAVANLVKKSRGKIKAYNGDLEYENQPIKVDRKEFQKVQQAYELLRDGQGGEYENNLVNNFEKFLKNNVGDKKEAAKIIDISEILNDVELNETRVGMAQGGFVA